MPGQNKYHLYVTFPDSGEIEVFPKNETISYGWELTNDIWRKKIDTKLWFVNENPSPKTFDIFATLELEECGCHRLNMRFTLECLGGVEQPLFNGILIFIDGEWFFDVCSVAIKPRVDDPFECLFKNWETDINVLEGSGDPITLTTDTGNFETVVCQQTYDEDFPGSPSRLQTYEDFCLPAIDNDFQVLKHEVDQATIDDDLYVRTTWIREVFNGAGPPPGAGWTLADVDFWTRPVILQGPTIESYFMAYYATWEVQSRTLDNGRLLADVLINLFSACSNYELRSDFFGIDPDGQAPVNDAYEYAEEWIHDAVAFSMGDVVRFGAFENSTQAMINLKALFECFKKYLRVFLYFDEDNNVYRIEHDTYERHNKLINLVQMRPDAIRGYNTYTYLKEKIPQKQVFKWSYQTNDEDWDNSTIIYPDCNDVGRIEENEIECFHTDFGSLIGSGIEDIDVLKGLVIVAQKDGQIHRAPGDISGIIKANGGLSWANIVRNLWRWRMPSCEAIVNGVNTTFLSLVPKILQTEFDVELCCSDILQLNPATDRVRTGLGNGEFHSDVDIDLQNGLAKFKLVFAPPITLVDLTVSISVDDDFKCYFTDFIFQTNEDFPPGVSINWDFGLGAVPQTATGEGPHSVYYTTTGVKTITVTAAFNGDEMSAQTTVTVASCPANILGGVYDDSLFPFQGVNVRLYKDENQDGVSDGGTPVRSIFTSSGGAIAMASLPPGYYCSVLTMPTNWSLDMKVHTDEGTHPGNNLMHPNPDNPEIAIRLVASELDKFHQFYLTPNPGTISGSVRDDGAMPIVGAQVDIYADDDLDGVADGPSLFTAFTDVNGDYVFNDVPVAFGGHTGSTANTSYKNYVIVLTVPVGYTIVSGIDSTNDGDLVANSPTTDEIIPCTLTPGENDANNNFIIQAI